MCASMTPRASPVPTSAACSRRRSTTCIHAGVFPDQKALSAIAHLKAALACYKRLGVTVKRVMTDNGPCYTSHAFAATCKQFGLKHIRTKPYTPRTHGKAERFIQTALREWAYARAYQTSKQRAQDLPLWTHSYNWHRPHSGIKQQTPIGHLNLNQNNLLRFHRRGGAIPRLSVYRSARPGRLPRIG